MAQANVKIAVDATSAVNKLRQVNTVSKRLSSTTDRLEQSVRRNNKRFRETGAAARTASAGVNRLGAAVRKLLIGLIGLYSEYQQMLIALTSLHQNLLSSLFVCLIIYLKLD